MRLGTFYVWMGSMMDRAKWLNEECVIATRLR